MEDEIDDSDESEDEYTDEDEDEEKDLETEKTELPDMSNKIQERLEEATVTDSHRLSSDESKTVAVSKDSGTIKMQTDGEMDETSIDQSRSCACGDSEQKELDIIAGSYCHRNTAEILSGEDLLALLRKLHTGTTASLGQTTIGMVKLYRYRCEIHVLFL